jgi:Secretin and TonB N terminus short domain
MIQARAKLLLVLLLGACGEKNPPASSPVSPSPAVAVARWAEPAGDPNDIDDAPRSAGAPRSLYLDGPRTLGGGARAPEPPRYHGARIDLDVKAADIHEVCRLLADVGKVNIVVSDQVQGTVTIKMKGVPWDQALETILRAKGFRAERDGSVIMVLK